MFLCVPVLLCVVFVQVCCEVGGILEQGNGNQQEEDPHLDKSAKENSSDCGTCWHLERALEGSQRNWRCTVMLIVGIFASHIIINHTVHSQQRPTYRCCWNHNVSSCNISLLFAQWSKDVDCVVDHCRKVPCLVRQSLSGQAPLYLADDCCLVSDSACPSLWSADVPTGVVPRTLSSYGDRTFAAAGPHLRNSLPVQLHNPDISYGLSRRQLKGHLFSEPWTRRSVTSICGALEKHLLTYLLTYLHCSSSSSSSSNNDSCCRNLW